MYWTVCPLSNVLNPHVLLVWAAKTQWSEIDKAQHKHMNCPWTTISQHLLVPVIGLSKNRLYMAIPPIYDCFDGENDDDQTVVLEGFPYFSDKTTWIFSWTSTNPRTLWEIWCHSCLVFRGSSSTEQKRTHGRGPQKHQTHDFFVRPQMDVVAGRSFRQISGLFLFKKK